MAEISDPLDFEFEEPIRFSQPINKRKKKTIGLDDLLEDFVKEQKESKRKLKRAKVKSISEAEEEEEEDVREADFSNCVNECLKQIDQISGDESMLSWGIQAFGDQKTMPPQDYPELERCGFLESFNDLNSLVELDTGKGEAFLEGLLVDGWLLKLVSACGRAEKPIGIWIFNLMLYSSKEVLRNAACEFWCAILSHESEADSSGVGVDWLPSYSELKLALETYGFLLGSPKSSSDSVVIHADSDTAGPPQNIRYWLKCVAVCCQVRKTHLIFSTSEAEDFLAIIICLFLDRQLVGISKILYECMTSIISFFKDEEWCDSCKKVAKSIVFRVPSDVNCLRIVESISGVDARSKTLRSAVAFEFLVKCLDKKVSEAEEILRHLIVIDLKDKHCDLLKTYIHLCLTENWLSFNPALKDEAPIQEMWCKLLRNCSRVIAITDLRPYASKIRSKASYLLGALTSKIMS